MMATKVKYAQIKVSLPETEVIQLEKFAKILQESVSQFCRNAINGRVLDIKKRRG